MGFCADLARLHRLGPSLLKSDWFVFRRRHGPDVQEDRGRQQQDDRRADRQRDRVLHPAARRRAASELIFFMHVDLLNFLSSDACGSFQSKIRTMSSEGLR